jgi:hypothetical protein
MGLTILPPSCADCLKIWEPQPPGTLRACNRIALPFYVRSAQLPKCVHGEWTKSILLYNTVRNLKQFILSFIRVLYKMPLTYKMLPHLFVLPASQTHSMLCDSNSY